MRLNPRTVIHLYDPAQGRVLCGARPAYCYALHTLQPPTCLRCLGAEAR